MTITMEAETPQLFLTCFTIVFILKALLGAGLLFRNHRGVFKLFLGHLAAELMSFAYMVQVLFRNRIPPFSFLLFSDENSLSIGLFGVCWFVSVCFLLAAIGLLASHTSAQKRAPEA